MYTSRRTAKCTRTERRQTTRRRNSSPLFRKLHPRLPVFEVPLSRRHAAIYIPGGVTVALANQCSKLYSFWNNKGSGQDVAGLARYLEERARKSMAKWHTVMTTRFSPECLTVYLSNQCNCECAYCYAALNRRTRGRKPDKFQPLVDIKAVAAAGKIVALSCRKKGVPFRLVVHGGGEPTLHWQLLKQVVQETRKTASQAGVRWLGHIATNGIISREQASWLSRHFDTIGISHDGTAAIQNRQRPVRGGQPSANTVERTIRILRRNNVRLHVRTTLLPSAISLQSKIVEYLAQRLGVRDIRFEPVYRVRGKGRLGFRDTDADLFARYFLAAQERARSFGATLSLSGTRLHELHGPYCDVLRNVVHIVPPEAATSCFFTTDNESTTKAGTVAGGWDRVSGRFILNTKRIEAHRRRALRIPETCRNCLCVYHCTKGCPDVCRALSPARTRPPRFRCRVMQLLAVGWIRKMAVKLVDTPATG